MITSFVILAVAPGNSNFKIDLGYRMQLIKNGNLSTWWVVRQYRIHQAYSPRGVIWLTTVCIQNYDKVNFEKVSCKIDLRGSESRTKGAETDSSWQLRSMLFPRFQAIPYLSCPTTLYCNQLPKGNKSSYWPQTPIHPRIQVNNLWT